MAKLDAHVKSRGADCMRGLARAFDVVDKDHNHVLDREEFKEALAIWDMTGLNEAEINVLMAHFDDDGDGLITYSEFLHGLRGEMNERRINMVTKAYRVLDANHDGVVTLGDIMATYNVEENPLVQSGQKSPEEVFKTFLDSFEGPHGDKDGTVTISEFIDYYSGISAAIDDDDYFVLMMENAWKIVESDGEFALDDERVGRLELQLRDKLLQKKKDTESETKCLLNAFKYFNLSGSNLVDIKAFTRTCERFGLVLSPAEMQAWFDSYLGHSAADVPGHINYEAFTSRLYPEDGVNVRPHGVDTTPGRGRGIGSGDGLDESVVSCGQPVHLSLLVCT